MVKKKFSGKKNFADHDWVPDNKTFFFFLNSVIAFATIALENNYHRPELTLDRKLKIINGRHPLQEICVDNFVPNDLSFDTKNKFIKIL